MSTLPQNNHIIVNYHYVEDPREDFSGIHPCPVEKFDQQIQRLSEHYTITSVENVYEAAQKKMPERYCAITFDDGLKDQYENAVPILKKYGTTAIFFPITCTFTEGFVPATHKMHILLSRRSPEELVEKSNVFFKNKNLLQYTIPADKRITHERKLYDDMLTANLKETINVVPQRVEKELLDFLFSEYEFDEKKVCGELFMTKEEIGELARYGFSFGSHTHRHVALDTAESENLIERELRLSTKHLEPLVGAPLSILSYPHGGAKSAAAIRIAKATGFTHAVSIEHRSVERDDDPFYVPRYDTNDLS